MSVIRLYLPIEAENYHQAYDFVTKGLAKRVGGWTNWRGTGGWIDNSGETVTEPVMIIEGIGEWDQRPTVVAAGIASSVKEMTNEDAVMAVADGEKVLV